MGSGGMGSKAKACKQSLKTVLSIEEAIALTDFEKDRPLEINKYKLMDALPWRVRVGVALSSGNVHDAKPENMTMGKRAQLGIAWRRLKSHHYKNESYK